jgi:hypothetical protein
MSSTSVRFLKNPPGGDPDGSLINPFSQSRMSMMSTVPSEHPAAAAAAEIRHSVNVNSKPLLLVEQSMISLSSTLRRPFNTMTFVSSESNSMLPIEVIPGVESMTSAEQEDILIQELLYVLSGVDAVLIRVQHQSEASGVISFTVCQGRIYID